MNATDLDALIRATWGEARGESPLGQQAVAAVIRNRADALGQGAAQVVAAPGQFEGYNADARALDSSSADYRTVLNNVMPMLQSGDDPTGGATHFYAPAAQQALGRAAPSWDDGTGLDIGGHRFFKRSMGDAGAPAPQAQSGADIFGIGDDGQGANSDGAQSGADIFGLDESNGGAGGPAKRGRDYEFYKDPKTGELTIDILTSKHPEYLAWKKAHEAALNQAREGVAAQPDWLRSFVDGQTFGLAQPAIAGITAADAMIENAIADARGEKRPFAAKDFGEAFDAYRAAANEADEAYMRDHPGRAIIAGLAGGLLTPGVGLLGDFVGGAKSIGGAVGRSALLGGAGGAVYGGATARPGDELRAAGWGAASGAVAGAAAPTIVAAVKPAASAGVNRGVAMLRRLAGDAAPDWLPAVQAARPKPELRAAAVVDRALTRDETPVATILNDGRAPLYAGGDNLAALAEVAAQSPGPSRQIIPDTVTGHMAGAGDRVQTQIGNALGGKGDYLATLDSAIAGRQQRATPLFDAAFSRPVDQAKYQAEVAPLIDRAPKRALGYAAEIAKRDGVNPSEIGLSVTGADANGLPVVDAVSQPTMKTLHYIKKGMDAELSQFRNPQTGLLDVSGNPMAASTASVRNTFGKALTNLDADYAKAMKLWGDEGDHFQALQLGRNVFSPSFDMSAAVLRKSYGSMNQVERDYFRKGIGEALVAQARSATGGVGAMRQLLRSDEFADRVKIAFPYKQAFDDFMSSAAREVGDQNRGEQIIARSGSSLRDAARRDLERQPGIKADDMFGVVSDVLTRNVPSLAAKTFHQLQKAIPHRDRSILGDKAANAALGSALTDSGELQRLLDQLAAHRANQAAGYRAGGILAVPADNVAASIIDHR